jgi:hypothetical protein
VLWRIGRFVVTRENPIAFSPRVRYYNVILTVPAKRDMSMYRCYFIQEGRIAQGCNLDVATLDAAIATARKILADHLSIDECDGLEIWLDRALLYKFSD